MARGAREFRDDFRYERERQRDEQRRQEDRERRMDEERRRDAFLDDQRREMERDAQDEALRRVVNDPDIIIDDDLLSMINDPDVTLDRNMNMRRSKGRILSARQRIRTSGQFANLALNVDVPTRKPRKKTKTDKVMRAALKEANRLLRKKNGELRKGVTQSQIMKKAHQIRRKLMS